MKINRRELFKLLLVGGSAAATACQTQKPLGIKIYDPTAKLDFIALEQCGLIDQNGVPFSFRQMEAKPFLADFKFTTCPLTCPLLSTRMADIDAQMAANGIQNVSFSVNPFQDREALLQLHQKGYRVHPVMQEGNPDKENWTFVTLRVDAYDKNGKPIADPATPEGKDLRERAAIYFNTIYAGVNRFTSQGTEGAKTISSNLLPGFPAATADGLTMSPFHPDGYAHVNGNGHIAYFYPLLENNVAPPIKEYEAKLVKEVIANNAALSQNPVAMRLSRNDGWSRG